MEARKPRVLGKSKWEKRRIVKRLARAAEGKKPLVEPLQIAPLAERKSALEKGWMVFFDGGQRVELPLYRGVGARSSVPGHRLNNGNLVGIYKVVGKSRFSPDYVVLRLDFVGNGILFFEFNRKGKLFEESEHPIGFAILDRDLGHMKVRRDLRGRGIALKAVSRAERHVRSKNEGSHQFRLHAVKPGFKEIVEKLGYRWLERCEECFGGAVYLMDKVGKRNPRDNLLANFGFEAIDPKTGKSRMFYFPVGGRVKK